MPNGKDDVVIDYADPLIKAERLMRWIHDACLDKKYTEAKSLSIELITEIRMLRSALVIMEEKEGKL
jgi:hypothetical protein